MDNTEKYVREHPKDYVGIGLDAILRFGSDLKWGCEELGLNEEYAALIAAAKVIQKHVS